MPSIASPQPPSRVLLAPMAGVTDWPFRRQAVRFGAPYVVAEMTAGAQLVEARPDAMRRIARTPRVALHWLLSRNRQQFDPELIEALREVNGHYPPGTFVRLANRETAVVVDAPRGKPARLLPRSTDPRHQAAIDFAGADGVEVAIRGVAVAKFERL